MTSGPGGSDGDNDAGANEAFVPPAAAPSATPPSGRVAGAIATVLGVAGAVLVVIGASADVQGLALAGAASMAVALAAILLWRSALISHWHAIQRADGLTDRPAAEDESQASDG